MEEKVQKKNFIRFRNGNKKGILLPSIQKPRYRSQTQFSVANELNNISAQDSYLDNNLPRLNLRADDHNRKKRTFNVRKSEFVKFYLTIELPLIIMASQP